MSGLTEDDVEKIVWQAWRWAYDLGYAQGRLDALNKAATALDKSALYDVSSVVNWLQRRATEDGDGA